LRHYAHLPPSRHGAYSTCFLQLALARNHNGPVSLHQVGILEHRHI
jgi:hypothetical protein